MLIADQIRERANPWTTLFEPTRRARKDFNKGGDSQSLTKLKDIRPSEGGVIKLGKGHVAVRKAASGSDAVVGFVINPKTAKALGINVPEPVLLFASVANVRCC